MTDTHIKLILLDFDGTLADTRLANARAYVATLAEAGYELTEEEYLSTYFGMRCNEFLTRFGITDPDEREVLRLRKIALYPRFFDSVLINRPLWEFCRAFRAQGGRVWIVSTGSRDNIDNAMRHLGIGGPVGKIDGVCAHTADSDSAANQSHAFPNGAVDGPEGFEGPEGSVDGILAGSDVARSKPDPACFLEAMRREGVTPHETLIFEDSAVGLEAARRSGAAYIQVRMGKVESEKCGLG